MPDKIIDYSKVNIFYPVIGYTGMVHSDYMMSTINLILLARQKGIKFSMRSIWFESLISRARNSSVAFMLAKDYTHLLFVDTDIVFNAYDVLKLIDADEEVTVGVYGKKYWSHQKMQSMASTGQLPDHWRYLATDFSTELSQEKILEAHKGKSPIETSYAATGFMLIKRSCIEKIIEKKPEIKYTNDIDGYMDAGDNFYDIFQCKVNPETKKYESEDYGFCKLWTSLGGSIKIIPDISLGHRGFNTYNGNLKLQANYYNP
jgi:hypothetical protein